MYMYLQTHLDICFCDEAHSCILVYTYDEQQWVHALFYLSRESTLRH